MTDENATDGLIAGGDGKLRCWWHGNAPDYMAYHDDEWGRPVADDHRLFEKICLEGFPVRVVLADHLAQARKLPAGICRI